MRRFFIEKQDGDEGLLWLNSEESRHAVKVLRVKVGEKILVFDSESKEFEAEILEIDPRGLVGVRILGKRKAVLKDNVRIHVAQGFLQKSKMDWIVEKGCEIGVESLIPIETEFSMVHPSGEAIPRIKSRWERIVLEAAKQSGNLGQLKISEIIKFSRLVEQMKNYDLCFLFHPHSTQINLKAALKEVEEHSKPLNVLLLIGPEGGFSDKEVQLAQTSGVRTVQLGQNILRAETAFIVLAGIFKILS